MKVVLLAGGLGTRISEESSNKPKPMVEIGGMPILWHIMKEYSFYGFNEFIICCGYKQQIIKQWFSDYYLYGSDVTFDYSINNNDLIIHKSNTEAWKVTCIDTGINTMTGGRIKRVQDYINDETFMVTYGDGVCDVNIQDLLKFHYLHGKKATLTAVVEKPNKGILDVNEIGAVRSFREKRSSSESIINAGYMVFESDIFDYLIDDTTILENEPLETLSREGELMSYRHEGYWQCMDTMREKELLDRLWKRGEAPWKVWK